MDQTLRSDDIAIGQLRIRGRVVQQQRLQQEIALANWPRVDGESWVFIRQLSVKAPAQRLSRDLSELTRDKLGKAKSPDAHNDVIRFNNFTELLAYLLADLADGRAVHCWYWQQWSHLFSLAPSAAIRHLLLGHLTDLPAISSQLHRQKKLAGVWLRLSDADSEQLVNELSWKLGIRLENLQADISTDEVTAVPEIKAHLLKPLFIRWEPLFKQCVNQDSRYLLALLIIALEISPMALQHAPDELIRYLANRQQKFSTSVTEGEVGKRIKPALAMSNTEIELNAAVHNKKTKTRSERERDLVDQKTPEINFTQDKRDDLLIQPPFSQIDSSAQTHRSVSTSSPVPSEDSGNAQVVTAQARNVYPASENHRENITAEDDVAELMLSSSEIEQTVIHTQQGGLFYGLNFLNRPECQKIMTAHWRALPDGWGWLYRLGQTLQLDLDDPVVDFICLQTGFDTRQSLEQLVPLPAADELHALAQRWYAKTEVWNSTLLQLDATIKFSLSHVDIHTAIDNVRLPVRLAGLDVNPGWLPWLGKVISFHYDR